MFQSRTGSQYPLPKERTTVTRCVRGNTKAAFCAHIGRLSKGKKVPLNRNMGVTNRNVGRLNISMLGSSAVKHMAMDPKANPPRIATGTIRKACGYDNSPNTLTTPIIAIADMSDSVAPQAISAVITSSITSGVASMASKVF